MLTTVCGRFGLRCCHRVRNVHPRGPAVAVSAFLEPGTGADGQHAAKVSTVPTKLRAPRIQEQIKPTKEPRRAKTGTTRPPSAFNLFVKDRYPALKAENPSIKLMEANAILREEWGNLGSGQGPFIDLAAAKKAELDSFKAAQKAEKQQNARPPSAYIIFVSRNYKAIAASNPELKSVGVIKKLGETWNSLPSEQMAMYKGEAAELMAQWKAKHAAAAE